MVRLKLSAFSGCWVLLFLIPSPLCPEAGNEFWYPVPLRFPASRASGAPATWPAHHRLAGCLPPSPYTAQVSLTRPPAQNELACPAAAARFVARQQTSSGPRSALAGCAPRPPSHGRGGVGAGALTAVAAGARSQGGRGGGRGLRALGPGRSRGGGGGGCRDGGDGGGARSGRAAHAAG